jgi:2-polyprenyl-3-methyl-5-hydroxy-6-metoxy-1,4-benzoquinol methylase
MCRQWWRSIPGASVQRAHSIVTVATSTQTSCTLCGSSTLVERERRGVFRYAQCASCSLAFVLNPPSETMTEEQYNQGVSSKLAYYRLAAAADARSFDRLLRLVERYTKPGSILDVGCNIGTFVRAAEARGWAATGVDLNREAVEFGRRHSGLRLVTLEEFESQPAQRFDVIHSSDTVEHFTDPARVMRYYVSMLKPDGLLALSTPNYDSRLCKIFQLKPTEHLFLFNQRSLSYMLQSIGLTVVATHPFDRYRNISAMFESTTFDGLRRLQTAFKVLHRVAPELPLRLPGGENIVAIARPSALD